MNLSEDMRGMCGGKVRSLLSALGRYGSIQGYTPSMLKRYYAADGENFPTGRGIRCGIVVPYGSPSLQEDLHVFSSAFSLPEAVLSIHDAAYAENAKGEWILESSLDTQWLHAFAPNAEMEVYFAASDSFRDVLDALQKADPECDIISLSLGKPETADETEYEAFFAESHALIAAAAGDNQTVQYPSCSQNVLCVGGTKLFVDSSGDIIGEETVWNGTGSGVSRYIDSPEYQQNFGTIYAGSDGKRAVPDVAFFASGEYGAAFYHSAKVSGMSGWTSAVGTSVGTPCVAGLCACVAEQSRKILSEKHRFFYDMAGGNAYTNPYRAFTDIVRGQSGKFSAAVGYDFCSGLGSPKADVWVRQGKKA